jgi:predicted aspartyl protease
VSVRFNPHYRLIVVTVLIAGPAGDAAARLALDTGASVTTLSRALLQLAGYDPDNAPTKVSIATGSGAAVVPQLSITRIEALGQARNSLPVLCHTFPPTVTVDGLLGLDFLRGFLLTVDFRAGRITLA